MAIVPVGGNAVTPFSPDDTTRSGGSRLNESPGVTVPAPVPAPMYRDTGEFQGVAIAQPPNSQWSTPGASVLQGKIVEQTGGAQPYTGSAAGAVLTPAVIFPPITGGGGKEEEKQIATLPAQQGVNPGGKPAAGMIATQNTGTPGETSYGKYLPLLIIAAVVFFVLRG